MDQFRRTPLHYLVYHLCYPKEVKIGLIFGVQIFTDEVFLTDRTQYWKRRNQHKGKTETEIRNFLHSENDNNSSTMEVTQVEFENQLKNLHQLVNIGPKAACCRDIDKRIPSDILHDCKGSFASDKQGPTWERADIACIILRDEIIRHYRTEKEKEEKLGTDRFIPHNFSAISFSEIAPSAIGTEGSSAYSGSLATGLSKLEVD